MIFYSECTSEAKVEAAYTESTLPTL